jgi:hypothetical protein
MVGGTHLTAEDDGEVMLFRLVRPTKVAGRIWKPDDFVGVPSGAAIIVRSQYAPHHLVAHNQARGNAPTPLCTLPPGSFDLDVASAGTLQAEEQAEQVFAPDERGGR